ncbi:MAG: 50S ribosomal protein L11 methyltransferase [Acidobacteriota bacterium]
MTPKYSRLRIPRKAKDDALAGLLWLHEPLGLQEEGPDLVACFRTADAARRARSFVEAKGYRAALTTDIPEPDPLAAFRAASRPFPVGRRLWIDPGDPADGAAPDHRVALRLPASRAFGTGGHESTRLALLALEEEVRPQSRVLDAGTGSGILALAAAGLGARGAVGFDSDLDAVFLARENARRHPFGSRVGLFAGSAQAASGRFTIVVANMLPEELQPVLPALASRLEPKGRLILSGIPAAREADVASLARARRLRLLSRYRENAWSCLCLSRASS